MSTIVLYKDRLNGINTYINDTVNSSDGLNTQLNSLKSILQGVSSNSCNLQDTVNNISSSTKTEKDKVKDLKKLNKKIGEFISVTVKKDNSVKEQIEKTKEEFYTKYSYLKPECEKNGLEKVCDGLKSAVSWLVDNIKEILVVGLPIPLLLQPP